MYNSDFQLAAHGPRVARQTIFDVTRKTFRENEISDEDTSVVDPNKKVSENTNHHNRRTNQLIDHKVFKKRKINELEVSNETPDKSDDHIVAYPNKKVSDEDTSVVDPNKKVSDEHTSVVHPNETVINAGVDTKRVEMIKDKKNVNKPKTNGVNGTSKPIWSTNNSRKMGGSTKTFSSRSDTPSSILSSDSDIRFTRKFSRNVRGPCCVLATFLVALLVAGIMYYLGC
ncbi:uncharacterized protein LOC113466373, partial [Diaphorina citri]|uniref:Uncharacterized protein LOC113466373 n=1 Tax=Diaphorina citri TaxID=121845 RepID=A0A3Q0IMP5_DIACI